MTSPAHLDEATYYRHAITGLATATQPLLSLTEVIDLDELQVMCGRFETLASILEPTAYMRGGRDNLHDQAAFLAALARFVDDVRKLDRRDA